MPRSGRWTDVSPGPAAVRQADPGRTEHPPATGSRATHADPAALVAACVIAACASWALEGTSPSLLLAVAADEAREAAQVADTEARLAEMLAQASAGTWDSPANGISPDPYETVAAVLRSATRATSLRSTLVSAVQFGGDIDTVAALVGGLMGGKLTAGQVRAELPWHRLVVLREPESAIAETATALATARAIQSAQGPPARQAYHALPSGYVIPACRWCRRALETDFRSPGHRTGRLLSV